MKNIKLNYTVNKEKILMAVIFEFIFATWIGVVLPIQLSYLIQAGILFYIFELLTDKYKQEDVSEIQGEPINIELKSDGSLNLKKEYDQNGVSITVGIKQDEKLVYKKFTDFVEETGTVDFPNIKIMKTVTKVTLKDGKVIDYNPRETAIITLK